MARALALPILLLTALRGGAEPQVPRESDAQDPEAFRISVDVNLVELHATVRDRKGSSVSDLRAEHFEVSEDGVRQSIRLFRHEDIPVTVGLVIDHSGSMRGKLTEVIAAARTFVQSSSPQDQMFVINFNDDVTLGLPAAIPFTNRVDELERAISSTSTVGQTALYDAVVAARKQVEAGSREKKVLIVISDGEDNASAHKLAQVLQMAQQSNILVYTIGIFEPEDPDKNPGVLRRLAQTTGGEAFFPGELSEVIAICERIARDIRNQYTLGYASTSTARAGVYRKISVAARADGRGRLSVRTRPGYTASVASGPARNQDAK